MSELSEMSGPQSASPQSARALGAHEAHLVVIREARWNEASPLELAEFASMAQCHAGEAGPEALLEAYVKETMRRNLVGRLAEGRKAARARRNSKGGAK